jgi:hypothetical protein
MLDHICYRTHLHVFLFVDKQARGIILPCPSIVFRISASFFVTESSPVIWKKSTHRFLHPCGEIRNSGCDRLDTVVLY